MFKPVSLFIGLRYTRAKRRNHFISFISLTSIIGIALGVAVLITVLSVMNGFDAQIRHRVFGMARQVTVARFQGNIPDWALLEKKLDHNRQVTAAAPFVNGQGMLTSNVGQVHGALVMGVLPKQESKVSVIAKKMVLGKFSSLKSGAFHIILGKRLAESLGVTLGNKVTLITPQVSVSPLGVFPRIRAFTVSGIFDVGNGFGFDSSLAMIDLHDAQALYQMGKTVSGIRLKLKDLYLAPSFANQLMNKLGANYIVSNWTQDYGALFQAIGMEKTMMFLILLLIVAVAAFNLVSTLVMVVTDKKSDIAILRTLGATPSMIMRVFMVQGSVSGIMGTLFGLIGGIILSLNATQIVNWLQKLFGVQFLSSNIYYVNFLPSKLEFSDVWHVCLFALIMSFLATLYPAWQASRTQPVEAFTYE